MLPGGDTATRTNACLIARYSTAGDRCATGKAEDTGTAAACRRIVGDGAVSESGITVIPVEASTHIGRVPGN